MVHVGVYYSRVPETTDHDARLTAAAVDLLRIFHEIPRHVPPAPAADLTMGQIRLLFLLRHEGPLPMGRIADVFDLSPTAATGFVGRVERHGLLRRRHREDDRRVVECELTDAGSRFVDMLFGLRLESIRSSLATLSERELAGLHALLERIRAGREGQA
jgi:DNA-binding MarR family transcriptional regulator